MSWRQANSRKGASAILRAVATILCLKGLILLDAFKLRLESIEMMCMLSQSKGASLFRSLQNFSFLFVRQVELDSITLNFVSYTLVTLDLGDVKI